MPGCKVTTACPFELVTAVPNVGEIVPAVLLTAKVTTTPETAAPLPFNTVAVAFKYEPEGMVETELPEVSVKATLIVPLVLVPLPPPFKGEPELELPPPQDAKVVSINPINKTVQNRLTIAIK